MTRKSIAVFSTTLLLTSWAVQLLAIGCVGQLESDAGMPWLIATMFIPTLFAGAYLTARGRAGWNQISWRPKRLFLLGLSPLIPAVMAFGVLGMVQLLGWGACEFFTFAASGAEVFKGPWLLGTGGQVWPLFLANIAITAIAFGLLNGIAAFGEEFCWRGLLQPHMVAQLGVTRGVALLGAIWALWHLPAILSGYNYPQTPILGGLVLFPIELVAMSFIMAWFTLRTESFWPAVLIHGSFNGIYEGIVSNTSPRAGITELHVDLLSVGVHVVFGLVFWLFLLRSDANRKQVTDMTFLT